MSQIGIEIIRPLENKDPKSTTPGGVAKSQNAGIASPNTKTRNHQNKAPDR